MKVHIDEDTTPILLEMAAARTIDDGPRCHGHKDGDCFWKHCPQLRDNEPYATGRHCPLDTREDYE